MIVISTETYEVYLNMHSAGYDSGSAGLTEVTSLVSEMTLRLWGTETNAKSLICSETPSHCDTVLQTQQPDEEPTLVHLSPPKRRVSQTELSLGLYDLVLTGTSLHV